MGSLARFTGTRSTAERSAVLAAWAMTTHDELRQAAARARELLARYLMDLESGRRANGALVDRAHDVLRDALVPRLEDPGDHFAYPDRRRRDA
jgi:hypothetical protein